MASQRKFLCPLLFSNELPELPFDPKLLEYPFDSERHYVYRPTTLEKEEKQIMLNEPNLGIPISIIDPLAYYCSLEQKGNYTSLDIPTTHANEALIIRNWFGSRRPSSVQ